MHEFPLGIWHKFNQDEQNSTSGFQLRNGALWSLVSGISRLFVLVWCTICHRQRHNFLEASGGMLLRKNVKIYRFGNDIFCVFRGGVGQFYTSINYGFPQMSLLSMEDRPYIYAHLWTHQFSSCEPRNPEKTLRPCFLAFNVGLGHMTVFFLRFSALFFTTAASKSLTDRSHSKAREAPIA